jgi:biotin carboxyl carrier protein
VNFDVDIGGRTWRVGVEPGERPEIMRLTIKGRTRLVHIAWIDRDTLSLIDGQQGEPALSYEIGLHRRGNDEVEISIGGRTLRANVASVSTGRRRTALRQGGKVVAEAGQPRVVAPMAGRVVKVLVAEGDAVTAGQGVAVIEAMKMENELRSPIDGVVRQVAVTKDSAIEAGALVALIDACR